MTIMVTRNAPDRYRGFLASCMCEIAPGVYTAPRMNAGIRERVWAVMTKWYQPDPQVSILMTWPDSHLPGGQVVRALGVPRQDLWNHDGIYLARREIDEEAIKRLESTGSSKLGPPPGAA